MQSALGEAQRALDNAQTDLVALKGVQRARAIIFARLASLPSYTKQKLHYKDEITQWWFGEDLYVELRVGRMEYTVTRGKEGYDLNGYREDWPQQSTNFKHSELDAATACMLDTFKRVQTDAQQLAEARRKYEEERPAREQRKKEKEADEKRLKAEFDAFVERLKTDKQLQREFDEMLRGA